MNEQHILEAPKPYNILVAVAFDLTAEIALREGARVAGRSPHAMLHVVHTLSGSAGEGDRAAAKKKLHELLELVWKDSGVRHVVGHMRAGNAIEKVLEVASQIDADLIVVGTHRRSGVEKMLLGSVAETILHQAECPVLVALPRPLNDAAAQIEPPCKACTATRAESANARFWCERHSRRYAAPHLYVPRDEGRTSIMPSC